MQFAALVHEMRLFGGQKQKRPAMMPALFALCGNVGFDLFVTRGFAFVDDFTNLFYKPVIVGSVHC